VTINFANIDPKKVDPNFLKRQDNVLGAPYDFGSIMHYGRTDFAINPNIATITSKNGASFGQRDRASDQDIVDLRLMYQCLSGPRALNSYNANLCTSDCKCWEEASGCNGDDAACRGDLKCENNMCVKGGGGGGSTGGGSGGCSDVPSGWQDSDGDSCQGYADNNWCEEFGDDFASDGKTANQACCTCGGGSNNGAVFIQLRNTQDSNLCIDVKYGSTTDGTAIFHSPCNTLNGGATQLWFFDANSYVRSAIDINKCLVGSGGFTDQGTNLIINTCFDNDDRFKWDYYTDSSLRPRNNINQCIGPSSSEREETSGYYLMELQSCVVSPSLQWGGYVPSRRERSLQDVDDTCADSPPGWYDHFGDNCEWYAAGNNCEDFGSRAANFGKTANQACCACGGGPTMTADTVRVTTVSITATTLRIQTPASLLRMFAAHVEEDRLLP
jgi:hypothetical protein